MNRPTLVEHGGFGTETYAREELRAEIAAMMTGERLGVGHEPRHGTAYVSAWIKALENDPREIRAAAVDAQRISDWLLSRERERSPGDEKAEPERPEGAAGRTPEPESGAGAGTAGSAGPGGGRRPGSGARRRDAGPGPAGTGGRRHDRERGCCARCAGHVPGAEGGAPEHGSGRIPGGIRGVAEPPA